jgi:hypothetical protein
MNDIDRLERTSDYASIAKTVSSQGAQIDCLALYSDRLNAFDDGARTGSIG